MTKISKILILVFVVIAIFGFGLNKKGTAQEELPIFVKPLEQIEKPLYAPDEIIVKFKGDIKLFQVIKIQEGKVQEEVEKYKKRIDVEYAEPNYYRYISWYPNDPYYHYQWHFDDDHTNNPGGATSNPYGGANGGGIRMEDAWPITSGSSTVIVAIVDTGIAYENYGKTFKQAPDLANTTFVAGYDFINDDSHPNDDNGHGTHVAGTVAQSTNNNLGVAGIAFNTALMPVKVLNKRGSGTDTQVSDGIHFATDHGAKVINLSLGGPSPSATLEEAVAYAYNHGVTVIAAAGNDGTNSIDYPAAYNNYVIAVGATRYDETRTSYSNYGSALDLVAPGGDVSVDQNGDGYGDGVLQQTLGSACGAPSEDFVYCFFNGTSMATPHVSGVAALLLAQDPTRTPTQIRNILQNTAEDKGATGWDQYYGYGIVDAYAALTYTPPAVSITLTTDGATPFSILALGATKDTTPSGTNDVQTVRVDTGPANLNIKTTLYSSGTNNWTLGSTNGINQIVWEYASSTPNWNKFLIANTLYPLATSVPQAGTQNIYFRLTMPTATVSSNQYSSIVTIVATAP